MAAICGSLQSSAEKGELTLARRLLHAIPRQEDTLLLADLYYGRGAFMEDIRPASQKLCQILVRAPDAHKARVLKVLKDGGALLEVRVCHPRSQRKRALLRLREVCGEVWRKASQGQPAAQTSAPTQVRLWTTLQDGTQHPAE